MTSFSTSSYTDENMIKATPITKGKMEINKQRVEVNAQRHEIENQRQEIQNQLQEIINQRHRLQGNTEPRTPLEEVTTRIQDVTPLITSDFKPTSQMNMGPTKVVTKTTTTTIEQLPTFGNIPATTETLQVTTTNPVDYNLQMNMSPIDISPEKPVFPTPEVHNSKRKHNSQLHQMVVNEVFNKPVKTETITTVITEQPGLKQSRVSTRTTENQDGFMSFEATSPMMLRPIEEPVEHVVTTQTVYTDSKHPFAVQPPFVTETVTIVNPVEKENIMKMKATLMEDKKQLHDLNKTIIEIEENSIDEHSHMVDKIDHTERKLLELETKVSHQVQQYNERTGYIKENEIDADINEIQSEIVLKKNTINAIRRSLLETARIQTTQSGYNSPVEHGLVEKTVVTR